MSNLRETAASLFAVTILAVSSTLLAVPQTALAQSRTGKVVVRVWADSIPVAGATVVSGTTNSATDRSGQATVTLPMGRRTVRVSSAGFRPESLALNVGAGMTYVRVALQHEAVARYAVAPRRETAARPETTPKYEVAQKYEPAPTYEPAPKPAPQQREAAPQQAGTASGRPVVTRRDPGRGRLAPTGVEVTDRFAIDEQLERSPGAIAGVLANFDGVRVQRLSAGSAGTGIRIRGLPSRYTKILMDGLPLFGATSEGLDLIQTPSLGVDRVEVVKGVSSASYGPSALAGVVNVVSAPPTSSPEALVNATSRLGSDVGIWQTQTFNPKWSASLVAGRHYENSGDPDGDGWAEASGYKRIVVRPRVYWSRSERSTWFMTGGWMAENRRSGTFNEERLPDFNIYREDNVTRRADAGTVGRITLDTTMSLTIRASMTREWRTRWYGNQEERNRRNMVFGDVALTKSLRDNVLVGGVALERDQYTMPDERGFTYRYTTPAFYAQHTWTPNSWFGLSSGARLDLHSEFGDFVSPRMAVEVRPSETFTARLSAASGVYAPTPLTDETEAFGLSHFRGGAREAEHATGWSLDLDRIEGSLELRGSAHRTVIAHPLTLRTRGEELELVNADEPSRTQGADVSVRYRARPLRYTLSYSFIDATRPEIGVIELPDFSFDTTMQRGVPLNPRHALGFDVAHERENNRVVGVSIHVVGRQPLSDTLYTLSRTYVTMDARLEKHLGRAILFASGRNLTGTKQGQMIPVLLPASSPAGTWTRDAWGPIDGLMVSAGLRMKY